METRKTLLAAADGITIRCRCGNRTRYTVDGWGRILTVETAEGGREEYVYDCAGNITASTDPNGKRQIMGTWEYDSFGQLTKSVAGGCQKSNETKTYETCR